MAEGGLFDPRWSEPILEETHRTLVTKLGVPAERAARRLSAMRTAFPEAAVDGFQHLESTLDCHPKDRHVLAAAIAAEAPQLVTANVRDFPPKSTNPFGVDVVDPDLFLLGLLVTEGQRCMDALDREVQRLSRPAVTARDLLAGLARVVPTFANTAYQAALDGQVVASHEPAYEVATVEDSPFPHEEATLDLTDPLHAASIWWWALMHRDEFRSALDTLTWSPSAFGDFTWAADLLDDRSMASRIYSAVDSDAGDVAFVRFVPEVAQTSKVFEGFAVHGALFLTMRRREDSTWCAWGLGERMVDSGTVLGHRR